MSENIGDMIMGRFMIAWDVLMRNLIIRTNPILFLENVNQIHRNLLDPLEAIFLCRNQCTIVESIMNVYGHVIVGGGDSYASAIGPNVNRNKLLEYVGRYDKEYIMTIKTNMEQNSGHDSAIFSFVDNKYIFESLRAGFPPTIRPASAQEVVQRVGEVGNDGNNQIRIYHVEINDILSTMDFIISNLSVPDVGEMSGATDFYGVSSGDNFVSNTIWRDAFVLEAMRLLNTGELIKLVKDQEEANDRFFLQDDLNNRYLIDARGHEIQLSHAEYSNYTGFDNQNLYN